MLQTLLQLLSEKWLIHEATLKSWLPLLAIGANGFSLPKDFFSVNEDLKAYAVNPATVDEWDIKYEDIPENSIAVINLQGVITSYKSQSLINLLQRIETNPKIISTILVVSSPGGIVTNTDLAANAIKNCQKPVYAYVRGLAASATLWIISACDQINASSQLDEIGSIGVMLSYQNIDSFLKSKLGIDIYELYATKSKDKNNEIRELLKGNDKPLIESLDFVNDIFHQTISENLGIDLNSEIFSGKVYPAKKAIELGLCHKICSFNETIQQAHTSGLQNIINQNIL